jgi:hypothetical protein
MTVAGPTDTRARIDNTDDDGAGNQPAHQAARRTHGDAGERRAARECARCLWVPRSPAVTHATPSHIHAAAHSRWHGTRTFVSMETLQVQVGTECWDG